MRKFKSNEIELPIPGIITLDSAIERFTVINKILCDYLASAALDYSGNEGNIKDIIERNNQAIILLKIQKREMLRAHSERKAK